MEKAWGIEVKSLFTLTNVVLKEQSLNSYIKLLEIFSVIKYDIDFSTPETKFQTSAVKILNEKFSLCNFTSTNKLYCRARK